MVRSKMKREEGISLVEVMVGMAIVLVALLPLLAAFSRAMDVNMKAKYLTVATEAANEMMEKIRSRNFYKLADGVNIDPIPYSGSFTATGFNKLPSPQGNLTIDLYQGNPNAKIVTVTVSWREGNQSRSIVQQTIVALGGINPS